MRILFITQKVDLNDDALGAYHRWIEELAKKVEILNAICLYQGRTELPANVRVYSLGKETLRIKNQELGIRKWFLKIIYAWRFYKYIWLLRKDYDTVFVHMNPEYVILAGWWWRLTGKKIILWYAHYLANLKLRLAAFFANIIVTSTRLAYPLISKKLRVLQQGIDTDHFIPLVLPKTPGHKVLFLGRITPVKNIETLLLAVKSVVQNIPDTTLTIVGEPTIGKPIEGAYYENIKRMARELDLGGRVTFVGRVANNRTVSIYQNHDFFVNLTVAGSFDKSTLESMSCGVPVFVSNPAFEEYFDQELKNLLMFKEGAAEDLQKKINGFVALPTEEKRRIGMKLRDIIKEKHSLNRLVERIVTLL
ncbi:MAG: glycosyltransferase [Parcubacteria group bacterium Gr01-1014_3]|nr:MAG: glycosyltransferase [Parcubacteria group bacterium Gr01-1014_3]